MTKNDKHEYETPQIEMMEARIEKGYIGSFISDSEAGDGLSDGVEYGNEIFS